MGRIAIISIDGHVKASRAEYRDYIEKKYLEVYDEQVKVAEEAGLRDAGNLHMDFDPAVQWDSDLRTKNLESKGVVAEVLFPNGRPFQINGFDDFARSVSVELAEEGRRAYNRWLVDFCSLAPGRRRGQMQISLEDVDQAVEDVYWAKEHGLGGIGLPAPPAGVLLLRPPVRPRLGGRGGGGSRHQPAWRCRTPGLQPSGVRVASHDHDRERVLLVPVALAAHRRWRVRPLPEPADGLHRDPADVLDPGHREPGPGPRRGERRDGFRPDDEP